MSNTKTQIPCVETPISIPVERVGLKPRRNPSGPFGYARDFGERQFVYFTISPRARGLSIGVNLNPDRKCNFDCIYCEVTRGKRAPEIEIDCDAAGEELESALEEVQTGALGLRFPYASLPRDLLALKHVALSGDGEPTQSPNFLKTVQTAVRIRALGQFPFFKIVLISNATGLGMPQVQEGLRLLTNRDEIWLKLEAGTEYYFREISRSNIPFQTVIDNILLLGKKRQIIIQSLFSAIDGRAPDLGEINAFAERLKELRAKGAQISHVQIYSATRPLSNSRVSHLSLKNLSDIAAIVRQVSGLRVELY
jgi:wyosine [tRNA(Phe)-imidazoG37] synthetase (radical SAM superfamily)